MSSILDKNSKVIYCLRPRKLYARNTGHGFRHVGWIWLRKAYLIKNVHHGWIAFVDDQIESKLNKCPACGRYFHEHDELQETLRT